MNTRLYMIGLMFIVFELETILLFPWATVWLEERTQQITNDIWNLYMAVTGTFFILVLGLALVYAVIKGRQIFNNPAIDSHQHDLPSSKVQLAYYERMNTQYATAVRTTNE